MTKPQKRTVEQSNLTKKYRQTVERERAEENTIESFYHGLNGIIMDLANSFFLEVFEEKATMQEGFNIDKNLANRLDNLLKEGGLDKETEILEILETLSEKLNSLENNNGNSTSREEEAKRRKNRIHQKWEKDPFSQEM